jgi:hypothetical protein
MDQKSLYKYALIVFIFGLFILLGVVLFVPFSPSSLDFRDVMLVSSFPSQNGGQVIIVSEVKEYSIFIEEDKEFIEGSMYRIYDLDESDSLSSISYIHSIS